MEQISHAQGDEFLGALRTTRRAKNVLLALIVLALAVQMACFVVVRFTGLVKDTPIAAKAIAERDAKGLAAPQRLAATRSGARSAPGETAPEKPKTQPATAPAAAAQTPAPPSEAKANVWAPVLQWVLPATKLLALAAGLLLILTLMFAVKIALHGRTGGVSGFISAFYWSLILWLPLVPWQQVLPGSSVATGAFYNLGDLVEATAGVAWGAEAGWPAVLAYYARFVVYPLVVIALTGAVCMKFSWGWRRASVGVESAGGGPAGDGKM